MNHFKQKSNNSLFVGSVLVSFFALTSLVLAAPQAPNPICEIEADVLSVEKTKTITPPINTPSREIEHYFVTLKILKVSTYQSVDFMECDNFYPVNSEAKTILFLYEYDKSPVAEGQKIKGRVNFGGDETFAGIFLSNISILSQPPEPIINHQDQDQDKKQEQEQKKEKEQEQPITNILDSSEVSEKLLQQNYIDKISDISLQPDQQTYRVQGTKKGRLFFFIPVTLNIQLEVDATIGTVKKIKKPWWSFLAK